MGVASCLSVLGGYVHILRTAAVVTVSVVRSREIVRFSEVRNILDACETQSVLFDLSLACI